MCVNCIGHNTHGEVSGPDKHHADPSPSTGLQTRGDREHLHLRVDVPRRSLRWTEDSRCLRCNSMCLIALS
jgi:hypothetical protein